MILAILGCLAFSRVVGAAFVPEDDRALADRLLMHWNTHAADVFVRAKADLGVDLMQEMPVLQTAFDAANEYLFPDGCQLGFGDTHPAPVAKEVVALQKNPHCSPFFHAPNASWLVARSGMDRTNDVAFALNASLGNHMHANGISLELYAKGYRLAPDAGIGWSLYSGDDYKEYYSQFPAHNTVMVNSRSTYQVMKSYHPFTLEAHGENWATVRFREPCTGADQQRTDWTKSRPGTSRSGTSRTSTTASSTGRAATISSSTVSVPMPFLAFCAAEKLPVDFISCHPYPTDYALDPESGRSKDAIRYVHSLRDDMDYLRRTLAKSAYPKAEIHLTEWSTSPNSRDGLHDRLPPCAYLAKALFENLNKVDSLMYWTFTDIFEEKGGGGEIFHGSFGLLNFQGIPKPTYHAFRMFNALGDTAVYNADPVFVTRDSRTGKTSALVYAYPSEYEIHVPSMRDIGKMKEASPTSVELTLTGLPAGASVEIETLDFDHGDAYSAWEAMGRPHSPTRAETAALKSKAEATARELVRIGKDGTLVFNRRLQPWTLVLIREL